MQSFKFSGHETFTCKLFWPKKGVDFLLGGHSFNEEDAVVQLGVGKNMVSSIRFWLKAFGLVDEEDNLIELARMIFEDDGYDPYLEDIGTIWLLHYLLVTQNYASVYNLVFNHFLKERNEFTKNHLVGFLKRITGNRNFNSYSEKTFEPDVSVFLRSYLASSRASAKANIEEEFASLFIDLQLIERVVKTDDELAKEEFYLMSKKKRPSLPPLILLWAVVSKYGTEANITLNELFSDNNSIGNVFLLSKDDIYEKMEIIAAKYPQVTFSQTAGNYLLHLDKAPDTLQLIRNYYEK